MRKNGNTGDALNNIVYTFAAQSVSLLLSVIMSLIVPKLLGVEEFSYWQLFLFYAGYLGFFHFGLNDGIYLRLGGAEYKNLNYSLIGSQLRVSFVFQFLLAFAMILISIIFVDDWNRRFVWIGTAIYLPLFNATAFIGDMFQAVNKIKLYSLIFTVERFFIVLAVCALLILKCDTFIWFIVLYITGKFIALTCGIWYGREIVFAKALPIKNTLWEIIINISVGINLMFSNIASMLILGTGRFVVDNIWGITVFGKFSFSISLVSFFLLFISQISIVLFPTLRRVNEQDLKKFYYFSRDLLGIFLAGVLLAYLPLKYLLGLWLPQYNESLQYLALLLPLCTYDGKMNMLCTTYLKVLRKERLLLKINLVSLAGGSLLSFIGGYLLHNIYAVVISMVVTVAFRSVVSEIYLAKFMDATVAKNLISEFVLVVIFMTCTWFISPIGGFVVYLIAYATYLIVLRNKLILIVQTTRMFLKERGTE